MDKARSMFPDINITDKGHRYLGSYIGTDSGAQEFILDQVNTWKNDITAIADIATKEPQLAYSAFVYGTVKRWNYVARTTPNISNELKLLEVYVTDTLIPNLVGKSFLSETTREIFSLPAKMGGLGLINISEMSNIEYENSIKMTMQLTDAVYNQHRTLDIDREKLHDCRIEVVKNKLALNEKKLEELKAKLSTQEFRHIELASEKGASCWLTSLPLSRLGFTLNKQEFHDAIALRYNFKLSNISRTCICNEVNTINHALICKKGGYVSLRHNSLRDTTAELLTQICKDVVTEPPLLDLNGEVLTSGSNTTDNARLDVSCRSFWTPLERAFIDIRVFHPQAPTNAMKTPPQMYIKHETEKKRMYNSRVLQVEKGTFTPIVFSTSGGMGLEAQRFFKRLAEKISRKTGQKYSEVITFIRRRLRFDLLKTTIIALRGHRGSHDRIPKKIEELDLNLMKEVY